jgi:hypothetical protein
MPDGPLQRSLCAALLLSCTPLNGAAEVFRCPDHLISVTAPDLTDVAACCEGVGRAIRFLRAADLEPLAPINVTVADPDDAMHAAAIGSYDARTRTLKITEFERLRAATAAQPPFGVEMDREMYISFVAHEAAHAIAQDHFATARPTVIAHEYVAYTVQLATMAEPRRARILAASGLEGFAREEEVSLSYYLAAPHAFGIKSYLHWARPENGALFLREVLADRALRRSF